MDWAWEFDYCRKALHGIVAVLCAYAGLDGDFFVVQSLPRYAYRAIMLILRPAESAVRRLIIVAASKLTVEVKPGRPSCPSPRRREGGQPFEPQAKQAGRMRRPDDSATGSIAALNCLPDPRCSATCRRSLAFHRATGTMNLPAANRLLTPTFKLVDPRKRFAFLYEDAASDRQSMPNTITRPQPELPTVDDYLIPPDRLCDRLGFKRTIDPRPDDYEPVATTKLSLRLRSLKAALDDIDAQALRLARLEARSRLETASRQRRRYPKRPGFPPGYRKRRIHRVDELLDDCHKLALRALEPKPDTS